MPVTVDEVGALAASLPCADELRDLVEEAWSMVVPKYVAEQYALERGYV